MMELTVAEHHRRILDESITCTQIVETYLNRIKAYDQSSGLNSIVVLNPKAVEQAQALDARAFSIFLNSEAL